MVRVTVTHKKVSPVLPLIVVAGSGPNLLGRGWLQELALHGIFRAHTHTRLRERNPHSHGHSLIQSQVKHSSMVQPVAAPQ